MKKYSASTTINAAPNAVWKIITDAAGYPQWDLSMEHVEGNLALGEQVKFFTKLSPNAFPVKVTVFEPNRRMVLTGGLPIGLFKSERTHTLTSDDGMKTILKTEEIFSGLLLPVFGRNIPDLTANFQTFVAAVKKRAENSVVPK